MDYAKGIDISRYNISFNPDLAQEQIDFVFQKATEGAYYVDLKYEELWEGVRKINIRGAYHYQRSGVSWLQQANHFLNTIDSHDYQMLALDLEEYGNVYNNTFFSDTKRIVDYWRLQRPNNKVVLYTNGSTYKQLYYSLIQLYGYNIIDWLDGIPLWIASPATEGEPFLPLVRKTWEIHQYFWKGLPSDWGTGGTAVDENVFNGTTNDMRIWLGLDPEPVPEPEPEPGEDMYIRGIVNATAGLRVREQPNSTATVLGILPFQTNVEGYLENGWIRGTFLNLTGYISSQYVSYDIVPDPNQDSVININLNFNTNGVLESVEVNGETWIRG